MYRPSRVTLALVTVATLFGVAQSPVAKAQEKKPNTLLSAKVVNSQRSKKGITHTWRLTLSDGTVTHDASFQSIYSLWKSKGE